MSIHLPGFQSFFSFFRMRNAGQSVGVKTQLPSCAECRPFLFQISNLLALQRWGNSHDIFLKILRKYLKFDEMLIENQPTILLQYILLDFASIQTCVLKYWLILTTLVKVVIRHEGMKGQGKWTMPLLSSQ